MKTPRHASGGRVKPSSLTIGLPSGNQLLWSKSLPNGVLFDLSTTQTGSHLRHKSDLGEFHLFSDTVIRSFHHVRRAATIIDQIPEAEREWFSRQGYTIGGRMVFPGSRVDGHQSIKQRRKTHPKVEDRFDLTLEYIGTAIGLIDRAVGDVRVNQIDSSPLHFRAGLWKFAQSGVVAAVSLTRSVPGLRETTIVLPYIAARA